MANQNNIKLINGINGELSIEADKGNWPSYFKSDFKRHKIFC